MNNYYTSAPSAPSAPLLTSNIYPPVEISNDAKLEYIKQQYEISSYYSKKLEHLRGIDIVLLCDDSGSMSHAGSFDKYLNKCLTRWEELKQRVQIIMEISSIMDPDGIDIYFLNRSPVHNVKDINQINHIFASPPLGGTPLNDAFNKIIRDKTESIRERKVLIVIATDGEPSKYDNNGKYIDGKAEFMETLRHRRPIENILISIMACTDDKDVLTYLHKLDKEIPYLDVVDDYENEKKEIFKCTGTNISQGDYIVKTLIGAIDLEFDQMDEQKACCIIS